MNFFLSLLLLFQGFFRWIGKRPLTLVYMHELSIARSIVELAEEQARLHGASVVEELELEIGALAGVEIGCLEFALASAVKGTLLEETRMVRHDIPGEGQCEECKTVFVMDSLLTPCPMCGSWWVHILRGKELRIRSLVVN